MLVFLLFSTMLHVSSSQTLYPAPCNFSWDNRKTVLGFLNNPSETSSMTIKTWDPNTLSVQSTLSPSTSGFVQLTIQPWLPLTPRLQAFSQTVSANSSTTSNIIFYSAFTGDILATIGLVDGTKVSVVIYSGQAPQYGAQQYGDQPETAAKEGAERAEAEVPGFSVGGVQYQCGFFRGSTRDVVVVPILPLNTLPILSRVYDYLEILKKVLEFGYLTNEQLRFQRIVYEISFRSGGEIWLEVTTPGCEYEGWTEEAVVDGQRRWNKVFPGVKCGMNSKVATGEIDFPYEAPVKLQAYQFTAIGMDEYSTWLTPIHTNNLPLYPNQTTALLPYTLTLTFSSSSPHKLVDCLTIYLKSFLPDGTFPQPNPSSEILVCSSWHHGLQQSWNFDYNQVRYKFTKGFSCLGTVCWDRYLFIGGRKEGDDAMAFVEEVRRRYVGVNTQAVIGLQAGVYVYFGTGSITINAVLLPTPPEPPPPPTPNDNNLPTPSLQPIHCLLPHVPTDIGQVCPSISSALQTSLKAVISFPNLALLFRTVTFLRIVDDLTYYVYHKNNYGQEFRTLSYLCYNFTNMKWIFTPVQPAYESAKELYAQNLPKPRLQMTPSSYSFVGEDVYLLRQTDEYWLFTIPTSLAVFTVLHYAYVFSKRVVCVERVMRKVLFRFEWYVMFWQGVFGENIQYLAFRCFSQMYERDVKGPLPNLVNMVTMYVVMFCVLLYACSSYLLITSFTNHQALPILTQGYLKSHRSLLHLTILHLSKFVCGFIHGLLYEHPFTQILLLLNVHLSLLFLTVANHKLYTRKTILTIDILERLMRVFMHVMLLVELEVGVWQVLEGLLVGVLEGLLVVSVLGLLLENIMGERLGQKQIKIEEEVAARKKTIMRRSFKDKRLSFQIAFSDSQNITKSICIKSSHKFITRKQVVFNLDEPPDHPIDSIREV